jgi:hypothetical protein
MIRGPAKEMQGMGNRSLKQVSCTERKWRGVALGMLALVAVGAYAFSWHAHLADAAAGTPRLVVDRTEVDLGYLRFGVRARTTFALSNAGDGILRIEEVPRVIAKAGC